MWKCVPQCARAINDKTLNKDTELNGRNYQTQIPGEINPKNCSRIKKMKHTFLQLKHRSLNKPQMAEMK